jgi:hypothetical protein
MPRALPGIVGGLLAMAVVVPAPLASAQILARLRNRQMPAWMGRYDTSALLSSEYQRLAEMKVELALLSDIATFPYDCHAYANGNTLELRGNVPNETIRQRAMDLARRNTFLRGIDGLKIQPNLSVRSPLRPSRQLQQEAAELLSKVLGEPAKQMTLDARPNGVLVVTGTIDSVESKLEISRLFRRLPGCTAVLNELTVEPILHDGQRLVRVTRNGLLLAPPSALALDLGPSSSANSQLTFLPPLTPAVSNSATQEGGSHLPRILTKQPSLPTKPAPEKIGDGWEAFAPSKLPVKWGHPAEGWEAQAKDLETVHKQRRSTTPPLAYQQQTPTPAQPLAKPADFVWQAQPVPPQDQMPTPVEGAGKSGRAGARSHPNFAEMRPTPEEPVMTWRRPGGNEESEPKAAPVAMEPQASAHREKELPAETRSTVAASPAVSPLHSPRRWPSAYVTGSPPSPGRPGTIVFEEEPSPSKSVPAVIATTPPLAPAELQRRIKSLCGRQARDVVITLNHDGSALVRVKVANHSIEEQLSRKILALPEMNSSRVRLLMEIEP